MASDWCPGSIFYNLFFRRNCCFCSCAAETTRRDSESSSTSLLSSGISHEVFMNFRGMDTREEFTDLLHDKLKNAGIEVFKDDEKLCAGEEIKPGLKDAIKRSRISIAIFSKNYASSESCLMELVQMWECRKSNGQIIIPIFYNVSPHDVKHQAGDFAASFKRHKRSGKVKAKTIDRWKEVLQLVGELSGFDRENINGGRVSDLLGKVLTRVTEVLKKYDRPVTDKLVGIDLPVEEIMRKLGVVYSQGQVTEICGGDVHVVAICGMRGVGKTTLAKVVYNMLYKFFDRCSFLDDIDLEEVKVSQQKLIADLRRENSKSLASSDEGIKTLENGFRNMKVLIVLDGVREPNQLEALIGKLIWFGQGSRIIVTTDRRNVFIGLENEEAVNVYKVEPMSNHHAYQLFRKHAFQGDDDPQVVFEYNSWSKDIVRALGGHPLAIVLTARYLRHNRTNAEIWKETLELLKSSQGDGIEKKVKDAFMASYNSLDDHTKEMFLDVACFFNGKDWRIPHYMWKDCSYYPARGLNDLAEMFLLEIGENNELRMHNLLRDLGRKLVEKGVLHKHSRIWNLSDALSIIRDGKGTEYVEGIGLTFEKENTVSFKCEQLPNLPRLRYLGLDRANIQWTTENLFPNLRLLEWHACPSISELGNMHLKELVSLDLSWSPVTGDSQVWKRIMEKMEKLNFLNLKGCTGLPALLNFQAPRNLEILKLEDCTQLAQIGPFISSSNKLSCLNLNKCSRVKQLPLGQGCMKYLKELLIDGTGIRSICFQEGSLESLEIFSARGCEELKDISAIGCLRKLTSLALDDSANIEWVPAFEFPRELQRLSLRNCWRFNELPQSIGEMKLVEIDLSDTGVTKIPPSVKNLSNLKTLKMARTHLQKFPEEIVKLGKLEEIDFSGCRSLGGQVCCDVRELSSLRILRLSSSEVASLPQSICYLPCLQTLDIHKCNQLQALPSLPSSLLRLCWGSKNMAVPDLSYLTSLKALYLKDAEQPTSPDIEWITKLQSLEILELTLPNVTTLPGNFSALTQLREITLSYMKEPDLTQLPSTPSLWTLRLKHCMIPEPKFSSLRHLLELELDNCSVVKIDGLEDLQLLELLKIFHCSLLTNLNGLEKLRRLRKVKVAHSPLVILPELKGVEVDRHDL